jgi:GDP-4-dehydro-6-deoxy-D-mannose reductase
LPRALVTGVSGFVGSHLAEHLVACGDAVHGLVRDDARLPKLASIRDRLTLLRGDISDLASVRAALDRASPEHVYHLAAFPSPRTSFEDPLACHRVNVLGTAALFEAIRQSGARPRVLLVGSGEAYGRAGDRPIEERTPQRPISPYGASKVAAEMIAIAAHEAFGVPAIRARPFNHLGERQEPIFAAPSFAKQVAEAEAGLAAPEIRVGNLSPVRDFSDVRDVVRAYRLLVERGEPGDVYNVATGRGVTIRWFLERLVERARLPVQIIEDPAMVRAADIACLVGDPRRFEHATGFRLSRPLESTIETILDDWRRRVARAVGRAL